MTATNETYLPTYEDLYVPPLNLTSPALRAGAFHLAMFCDVESKEFMLCKAEESQDPRKCLKYNKEVSLCASRFFHKVKESCAESFTNYWQCLDNAPEGQMSYKFCRKTQGEFDKCMKAKLNLDRPEVGFLSKVRLFESSRPKPVEEPYKKSSLMTPPASLAEVPEAVDSLNKSGQLYNETKSAK